MKKIIGKIAEWMKKAGNRKIIIIGVAGILSVLALLSGNTGIISRVCIVYLWAAFAYLWAVRKK